MHRTPRLCTCPCPSPFGERTRILKRIGFSLYALRLLSEPCVELCLLLGDDRIDAGILQLLIELRKSLLRVQSAADERLVVLVDDVRAGRNLVRSLRCVEGEAERSGLLRTVVEVAGRIPVVIREVEAPDIADELVRAEPCAGLSVGRGRRVETLRVVDTVFAVP